MLVAIGGAAFSGFLAVHNALMWRQPVRGASAVFSVTGVCLMALPLAMLAANGISWILPPVRAANLRAMDGLRVSFGDINRGLILFGCVSVPVGVVDIVIAIFEPWAH